MLARQISHSVDRWVVANGVANPAQGMFICYHVMIITNEPAINLPQEYGINRPESEVKSSGLVKLSGLVKSLTKMVTECLRMTKVTIFVV